MKYFMTGKKLLRWWVCWVEFLSRFNFVIFYTLDRKNKKVDLFIHCPKNCIADDYYDQQQYLLQTILLSKRLEISFIDPKKQNNSWKSNLDKLGWPLLNKFTQNNKNKPSNRRYQYLSSFGFIHKYQWLYLSI